LSFNRKSPYLRRGKFYQKEDGTVDFLDMEDGPWHVYKFPTNEERNRRFMTDKGWSPQIQQSIAMALTPIGIILQKLKGAFQKLPPG